jgi:hypothetical protein
MAALATLCAGENGHKEDGNIKGSARNDVLLLLWSILSRALFHPSALLTEVSNNKPTVRFPCSYVISTSMMKEKQPFAFRLYRILS